MESGFDFELYETLFRNCFIHNSIYENGNLKLSLFGIDPSIDETAHLTDITLEQNVVNRLKQNEIVVDNRFKPTLVPQLEKLGILKEKLGMCIVNNVFYPIYSLDFSKIMKNQYYVPNSIVA